MAEARSPRRVRVGVLISGTGTNMAALLYASRLPDCPFEIAVVLANAETAGGLALARAEGVPTAAKSHRGLAREEHEAWLDAQLRAAGCDVVALAGYMRVLTPGFVSAWSDRMVNIHPSLLPRYPGLDTHARAIAAGDAQAGCTVHLVTAELDAGPTLGQLAVAIQPDDTPETLARRVLIAEHQLYPRALGALCDKLRSTLG